MGAAKDAQSSVEGTYILGPNLINGKPHWLQEGGSNAIWEKLGEKGYWIIGGIHLLGERYSNSLKSSHASVGPLEVTKWKYLHDGWKWSETTDVAILPGICHLSNALQVFQFPIFRTIIKSNKNIFPNSSFSIIITSTVSSTTYILTFLSNMYACAALNDIQND